MSQHQQDISYLQTLQSIRERTHQIWTLALADQLAHFHVRPEKLSEAVDLVMALIRRDCKPLFLCSLSKKILKDIGE